MASARCGRPQGGPGGARRSGHRRKARRHARAVPVLSDAAARRLRTARRRPQPVDGRHRAARLGTGIGATGGHLVSSDDAIISKTLDGRITSWNAGATRIFGYEASEMIGESILRIIPPELHGEEREILARLRRGERTVSPLRDRSGRVVGASKVGRDITDRKRAEKMQRVLTDELAHRVKNTLATVQAIANQSLVRAKSPTDFVS